MNGNSSKLLARLALLSAAFCMQVMAAPYDLVINSGRVMDPETGFDAVRNVGVTDGLIQAITTEAIIGERVIDASGLVVAPGFIDTHFHGMDEFAVKMALRDGVTSGMDLEAGAYNVSQWYADKKGKTQVNYGVAASYLVNRMKVMDPEVKLHEPVDATNGKPYLNHAAADGTAAWATVRANAEQMNAIIRNLDEELRQGALGVGLLVAYAARGATSYEVFEVQKSAARYGRLTSVHTRYHLDAHTPTEATIGFDEVFTNAMLLDAPLLLAHNNDYGWEENEEKLQMARAKGLNMWSEHYPYDAASTFVSADFLRPEVWLEKNGYRYEETIYHPESDSFLTLETYTDLIEKDPGTLVVMYIPPRKKWVAHWLRMPHMTVASDGVPGVDGNAKLLPWNADYREYAGHPRTAGARARTLRLARETGVPLMHSLAQLSYWSAKHLGDAGVKAMQVRGRVQEGMVADLTLFDPKVVSDRAGYKVGTNGLASTGIPWVIINGKVVVENSRVLQQVKAGHPIRYAVEEDGRFKPVSATGWLEKHSLNLEKVAEDATVSHLH